MKAGVTITIVIDCCHSGSVLELPYTFAPIASAPKGMTTVQMHENVNALSNLAFLHVLLDRSLPSKGFEDIVTHIESKTKNAIGEYQGIGLALEDHQGLSENENVNGNAHTHQSNGYHRDILIDQNKDIDSSTASNNDCIGGMCYIL
jgi:hypothetical protein